MQYYDLNLAAGSAQDLQVQGKFIYYLAGSTVSALDPTIFVRPGQSGNTIPLKPGQSYRMDADEKDPSSWRVTQQGNVETITGRILVGDGDFRDINAVGTISAGSVTVNNIDATAIPIKKQSLTTLTSATVTAGTTQVTLISDPTLRGLRIRNTHATANVAIGPTGVTLANAAIVLAPGDFWNEDDAPGVNWFVISDTASTSIAIQGVK